jgi:hypothetical protein
MAFPVLFRCWSILMGIPRSADCHAIMNQPGASGQTNFGRGSLREREIHGRRGLAVAHWIECATPLSRRSAVVGRLPTRRANNFV